MESNGYSEERKMKEDFVKRLVTNFLDVIIVTHFQLDCFSGYDVALFLHERLDIFLSPGTIYSTLYSMERKGYLTQLNWQNKKVFRPTEKGLKLSTLLTSPKEIIDFATKIKAKK